MGSLLKTESMTSKKAKKGNHDINLNLQRQNKKISKKKENLDNSN